MNLIEKLQEEIKRVNEIILVYEQLPEVSGIFGVVIMKLSINNAEKAISQMDTEKMVKSLIDLQKYEM